MRVFVFSLVLILSLLAFGCGENAPFAEPKVVSVPMRDIAADQLSYKYEADVPSPPVEKMAPIAKYEPRLKKRGMVSTEVTGRN